MNLLLLEAADADGSARVELGRYPPRPGLWPPAPGRVLRAGLADGPVGQATVTATDARFAYLRFEPTGEPPPALALTLLLALPRPKMLRRVLRSAAELGIKDIYLLNAARVEKSYWQSPLLAPATLEGYLRAGLEQACDTRMPSVRLRPRLRPFAEDELPGVAGDATALLAHPAATTPARAVAAGRVCLAIGPEGGFTDFEIALLGEAAGFRAISLGPRILRVETALPVLAATLMPAPQ